MPCRCNANTDAVVKSVGDRSKIEARKAEVARKFEEAKRKNRKGSLVRCGACRKSQLQVPVMVEMGAFMFCSECITEAYSVVARRKAGR